MRPIPCEGEKGLFPGRETGRGIPMPCDEAKGLFPGRGIPGVADGAAGDFAAAAFLGSAGDFVSADFSAAGAIGSIATVASKGLSVFLAAVFLTGAAAATSSTGASTLAAVFLAAAFLGASSLGLASGNASRSFLATGGAIVDEPLLTNSPSSASLARATLESIPSSLAMSYTRGSATYFSCLGPSLDRAGR